MYPQLYIQHRQKEKWTETAVTHAKLFYAENVQENLNDVPVKVLAHVFIPASRLAVPKSEIFSTPLYMLTRMFSPLMSRCTILLSC